MKKFDQIRIEIGARLKAEREIHGINQIDLAEKIGIGRLALIKYENGSSCPTAEHLSLLEEIGLDSHFIATGKKKSLSIKDREVFSTLFIELWNLAQAKTRKPSLETILESAWVLFDLHASDAPIAENIKRHQKAIALLLTN